MDITLRGKSYTVDEEAFGDLEIFEDLVEIQKGNPVKLPETIKAIIGKDGYDQLKDSVRDPETKRVKLADFMTAFGEIMTAAGQASSKKK